MNMIPALPFRAEPWVEDENFNDAFAWMEEWHNPTASERRGSLLAAAGVRWQQQSRQGQSLANLLPVPKDPLHRVLPGEIDQIVTPAKSQKYADLSHRILGVRAWDQGLFQASFSTVYRVLKERNLMTARGRGRLYQMAKQYLPTPGQLVVDCGHCLLRLDAAA